MNPGPPARELPESCTTSVGLRRLPLWGTLTGLGAGVLAAYPLTAALLHLSHRLYPPDPGAWGQGLSLQAWPLVLFFGAAGAGLGALVGELYRRLQVSRLCCEAMVRSLAAQVSLVEERERHRLATNLHEHLGHLLAMAHIRLGALGALATEELQEGLQEVRQHIHRSIQYTRSLTFELSPPVIGESFEAALAWLADYIRDNTGLVVEVQQPDPAPPLPEELRALLYLAARELLTNAAKHAQARRARVAWGRQGDNLHLAVEDDGQGFDAAHRGAPGFGLFSLQERLEGLGGRLEVKSLAGRGTSVFLTVPLTAESAGGGG